MIYVIKKIQRHVDAATIAPPNTGPTTLDVAKITPMRLITWLKVFGGENSLKVAITQLYIPSPPIP